MPLTAVQRYYKGYQNLPDFYKNQLPTNVLNYIANLKKKSETKSNKKKEQQKEALQSIVNSFAQIAVGATIGFQKVQNKNLHSIDSHTQSNDTNQSLIIKNQSLQETLNG